MGLTKKPCCTAPQNPAAVAPNPNPSRWKLLDMNQYEAGYVLKVKYHDCTNFEGVKIMVYRGKVSTTLVQHPLDPHFTELPNSPIARFRPDATGWTMANILAASLL